MPTSPRRVFLFDWLAARSLPEVGGQGEWIGIELAGLTLAFVTSSSALATEIKRYFRQYLSDLPAQAVLFVEPKEGGAADLWEDADPEFDCRGDRVVQRDFAARRFPAIPGERLLSVVGGVNPEELSDSILNLLRWTLPDLLLETSAFLVHAASVQRAGRGYLFFGQSGAGKSTTVRLISEADPLAVILGDDAAIIQKTESGYWLHAAPLGSAWTKEAPVPAKVPLAGLYSLSQSAAHEVESLSVAEGVRSLLASTMMAGFDSFIETRFDLAIHFASAPAGISRLHFRMDSGFWPLIQGERSHHV